jgi:hypothetical protein
MLADGTGEQVAHAYSKLLSSQPAAVCGKVNGLSSVDLALLGTGDDRREYERSMKIEHTRSINFWQSSSLPQQQHQDRNLARGIASSTNACEVSSLQTTGITSIRFGI